MSANKTIWLSFCSPLPTFKVNFSKGNRFIWPGSQHLTYGHIFAASPPAADDESAPPQPTNGWVKLSVPPCKFWVCHNILSHDCTAPFLFLVGSYKICWRFHYFRLPAFCVKLKSNSQQLLAY